MIVAIIAKVLSVKTVSSNMGTINYLYQKPENAGTRFTYDISPNLATFSVFMKATGTLSDVQYILNAYTSTATQISLLYKSAMGVDFQFVYFTYTCATCSRVAFTPVLLADVLGLFWCQFTIPQMDFMYVPQQLALIGCTFKVGEFYMSKGRYHTVQNNTILANNIVKSTHYSMVGTTLDSTYAKQQADSCIKCSLDGYSPDSRCSCPATGKMIAGECRYTFTLTDFTEVQNGISYFLECSSARNGFIDIQYDKIVSKAYKISVLKNDDCGISNVQVQGHIIVNVSDSYHISYAGLVYQASKDILNVNTSLQITQNGNGMGGTALITLKNTMAINISFVRIYGSIICSGTPVLEYSAMLLAAMEANVEVHNVGIFGGILRYYANRSSFGIAVTGGYQVTMIDVYIVPYLPPASQFIDTIAVESSAWVDESFPCYKQSSYEMQLSLKMKQYLDIYNDSMSYPKIVSDPGTTELGGLVSYHTGDVVNVFKRILVVIDIDDKKCYEENSCEGLGIFFGKSLSSFSIDTAYAQGNLSWTKWRTGMIGSIGMSSGSMNVNITMAGKVNINSGYQCGAVGTIYSGNHRIYVLGDLAVVGTRDVGFLGFTAGGVISMMCVGKAYLTASEGAGVGYVLGKYAKDNPPADLFVNGKYYMEGSGFNVIAGCSVNYCSDYDLDARPTVSATGFTRVDENGWANFHMLNCQSNTRINVSLTEALSGSASMRVLKDDSCTPINLDIFGKLEIATRLAGSHNISLSGLLRTISTTIGFINSSLVIKHVQQNTTRYISLLAWNVSADVEISLVRISGSIYGESGYSSAADRISGVLVCRVDSRKLIVSNIGIYGVQLLHGGTIGSGLIGHVTGGTLQMMNIIVVDSTEQQYLMSQLTYESFYYINDPCQANLGNKNVSDSANMRQYLNNFQAGKRSSFTYSIHSSYKVGGLVGYSTGAQLTVQRIVIQADFTATMDTSEAGLLFGAINGNMQLNQTFVSGNMTGGQALSTAGVIGSLGGYGSVSMMSIVNINGNQKLGTIGLSTAQSSLYVYFDATIAAQNTTGGLIGYIQSSVITFASVIGRVAINCVGNQTAAIVGSPIQESTDGSIINQC